MPSTMSLCAGAGVSTDTQREEEAKEIPSTHRCLLTNHCGILNWPGFCMMVTIRSSSSGLSSPALLSTEAAQGKAWGVSVDPKSGRPLDEDEPLGEVNVGLLADEVGVATTNTLDLGQGVLREA